MQTLESQKEKALADPEAFATMVVEGRIKARGMDRTLGPVGEVYPNVAPPARATANEEAADPDSEVEDVRQARAGEGQVFGEIPSAQNVVRMPHVNWTKYHIVGESLDKLHKEQRARPVAGQPLRDEDMRPRERAPESVIAAPYDPWKDKLAEKVKVGRRRSGGKKG